MTPTIDRRFPAKDKVKALVLERPFKAVMELDRSGLRLGLSALSFISRLLAINPNTSAKNHRVWQPSGYFEACLPEAKKSCDLISHGTLHLSSITPSITFPTESSYLFL
ncbi:hypothetical protein SLEP1_g4144 [Rubroshorea leprosula]|uniref:Uncharacterized protein n=1 Tax=Rubroshorea leprosula TaxID=152421 RepID=A0AAV5HWI1_9ROSI|nr:hypothetical protein SLEP1_g4144 [Rubroshorea leprosula]